MPARGGKAIRTHLVSQMSLINHTRAAMFDHALFCSAGSVHGGWRQHITSGSEDMSGMRRPVPQFASLWRGILTLCSLLPRSAPQETSPLFAENHALKRVTIPI